MASRGTGSSFTASTVGFFETKQTKHTYIMLEGQSAFVHEQNKYYMLSLMLSNSEPSDNPACSAKNSKQSRKELAVWAQQSFCLNVA